MRLLFVFVVVLWCSDGSWGRAIRKFPRVSRQTDLLQQYLKQNLAYNKPQDTSYSTYTPSTSSAVYPSKYDTDSYDSYTPSSSAYSTYSPSSSYTTDNSYDTYTASSPSSYSTYTPSSVYSTYTPSSSSYTADNTYDTYVSSTPSASSYSTYTPSSVYSTYTASSPAYHEDNVYDSYTPSSSSYSTYTPSSPSYSTYTPPSSYSSSTYNPSSASPSYPSYSISTSSPTYTPSPSSYPSYKPSSSSSSLPLAEYGSIFTGFLDFYRSIANCIQEKIDAAYNGQSVYEEDDYAYGYPHKTIGGRNANPYPDTSAPGYVQPVITTDPVLYSATPVTSYVAPTDYVAPVSTAYVAPTDYVAPVAYVAPSELQPRGAGGIPVVSDLLKTLGVLGKVAGRASEPGLGNYKALENQLALYGNVKVDDDVYTSPKQNYGKYDRPGKTAGFLDALLGEGQYGLENLGKYNNIGYTSQYSKDNYLSSEERELLLLKQLQKERAKEAYLAALLAETQASGLGNYGVKDTYAGNVGSGYYNKGSFLTQYQKVNLLKKLLEEKTKSEVPVEDVETQASTSYQGSQDAYGGTASNSNYQVDTYKGATDDSYQQPAYQAPSYQQQYNKDYTDRAPEDGITNYVAPQVSNPYSTVYQTAGDNHAALVNALDALNSNNAAGQAYNQGPSAVQSYAGILGKAHGGEGGHGGHGGMHGRNAGEDVITPYVQAYNPVSPVPVYTGAAGRAHGGEGGHGGHGGMHGRNAAEEVTSPYDGYAGNSANYGNYPIGYLPQYSSYQSQASPYGYYSPSATSYGYPAPDYSQQYF